MTITTMNITALNAVIAAASKHGFRVGIHQSFNGLTVFNTDDTTIMYAGTKPSEALTAIQRATQPQPEKYLTLDEAIKASGHPSWEQHIADML